MEHRKHYFDFLRVTACFAVMVIHVAAQNWLSVDVHSFEWQVFNFYDSLVRFGVPVFVMISGALFLNPDRDIPVRKLYSKYIFRMFTAFVFWSFVYAVIYYMDSGDTEHVAEKFITGHYHMWFLYVITGLYMFVPFFRKIAESESLTKYFLVLALIFTVFLPECADIISLFSEQYGRFVSIPVKMMNLYLVADLTGYFLLGYVLDRMNISPKLERVIYLAGIIGLSFTVIMSVYVSFLKNEPIQIFYRELTVNVLCMSVAVFVFCKQHFNRESSIVRKLSQYSFGVYLVHPAVMFYLEKAGLNTLTFSPVISVPVIVGIVFIVSFMISTVLNHIPVLKKYIV